MEQQQQVFKTLNPKRVWVPVLLGIGILLVMLYTDDELDPANLRLIFDASLWSVCIAFLVLLARDIGYIYRIRAITGKELSWTSAVFVIVLWEFASAVTPSVVGGTAVAIFILNKEGLSLGKSMAYVMLTAIMDNLFFITVAPLVLLFAHEEVFPTIAGWESISYLFFISYSLIAIYTLFMAYGLFLKPRAFKWVLLRITRLRWLKRWRDQAAQQGDEIMLASQSLKGRGVKYWVQISVSTLFIWTARYLMLNFLMAAYIDLSVTEHLLTFGRHLVMWIVMLISPTPGSSGTAEFFFKEFFGLSLGDYTIAINIFWRLLTYYCYLIVGAVTLSWWLPRVFTKKPRSVRG